MLLAVSWISRCRDLERGDAEAKQEYRQCAEDSAAEQIMKAIDIVEHARASVTQIGAPRAIGADHLARYKIRLPRRDVGLQPAELRRSEKLLEENDGGKARILGHFRSPKG